MPEGPVGGGELAYRYGSVDHQATLRVERVVPRLTARSYSFLRLEPELLSAHYELAYDVEDARTEQLSFLLPIETPADITIGALGGVTIKEYEGAAAGEFRRWTVRLAERRRDTIRVAVSFEQRLGALDDTPVKLPIVRADGVAYQSGLVARVGQRRAGGGGCHASAAGGRRRAGGGRVSAAAFGSRVGWARLSLLELSRGWRCAFRGPRVTPFRRPSCSGPRWPRSCRRQG